MATQRKRSLVVCHCDCRVPATQCIAYWTVAVYCILHVVFETSIPRLSLHTGKRKKSKRTESETGRCQVDLVDGHGRAEGVELERGQRWTSLERSADHTPVECDTRLWSLRRRGSGFYIGLTLCVYLVRSSGVSDRERGASEPPKDRRTKPRRPGT